MLWICKSPIRKGHKRKNWYVDVSIIPEVEEICTKNEVRIETYHSSGKGGQNVNKVETGVRVTHIPTGIVITSTAERSQYLNKQDALKKLGCRDIVITGIVQDDTIGNLTDTGGKMHFSSVHRTECLFSGTGDLFASVLCGALVRGCPLQEAAQKAGDFLSAVTQETLRRNTPVEEGVLFEPLLWRLGEMFNEA